VYGRLYGGKSGKSKDMDGSPGTKDRVLNTRLHSSLRLRTAQNGSVYDVLWEQRVGGSNPSAPTI
jgi:hypothetical protein